MDYEKKYVELTQGFMKCIDDISEEFPDATGFEKIIIGLRRKGWNYGDIQCKLGMPPKKEIRAVLLKWAPELIDNSKTKVVKIPATVSELYNIIRKHNNEVFDIWTEKWTFYIKDHKLYYKDEREKEWEFEDWDINSQFQIIEQIKEQINER